LSTTSLPVKEEQRPTPGTVETVRSVNGLRRGLPRGVGEDSWPPLTVTVTTLDEPDGSAFAIDATTVLDQQLEAVSESETTSTESVGTEASTKLARLTPVGLFKGLPKVSQILLGVFVAVIIGGLAIIVARLVIDIPGVSQFVRAFPGITELPESAPVGLPAWLGWQHFFNVFFMVLIIRTGIAIRREQRPTAYWAPRRAPSAKVSLTVWLHQSLDVLWLVNGVVFVVLLFATGQWMRIVPTSWEVFPNAISAALQYVTLDWPTENGWVNYNSLQVLAYFTTVFIASPLAAITGFRMSGMWPTTARRLNALYPMEWARAIHFPVMIYFCGFIAIHVFLVFTTGALKNLNHIYTGRDVVDWLGFWIFAATLAVVAAAWAALRPLFVAPIARLFGPVTSR
jgi:thiosulfate reductase cytochrome b subunit